MVFGRFGTFVIGGGCGAYVAQNYTIPNVAGQVSWAVERAKQLEQEMKKPPPNNGQVSQPIMTAAQLSPAKMR